MKRVSQVLTLIFIIGMRSANRPVRKSVEEARQLLAEAGYAGGQDRKGNPLIVLF